MGCGLTWALETRYLPIKKRGSACNRTCAAEGAAEEAILPDEGMLRSEWVGTVQSTVVVTVHVLLVNIPKMEKARARVERQVIVAPLLSILHTNR
jgi:hypothetical protein